MVRYIALYLFSVFISSVSQILLKRSADQPWFYQEEDDVEKTGFAGGSGRYAVFVCHICTNDNGARRRFQYIGSGVE